MVHKLVRLAAFLAIELYLLLELWVTFTFQVQYQASCGTSLLLDVLVPLWSTNVLDWKRGAGFLTLILENLAPTSARWAPESGPYTLRDLPS